LRLQTRSRERRQCGEKRRPRLAPRRRACFFAPVTAKVPPTKPNYGPEAEAARAARLEREAAALRENLRRRKAQLRAKDSKADPAPDSVQSHPHPKDIVES
jgi:uncharacterized membrane protein